MLNVKYIFVSNKAQKDHHLQENLSCMIDGGSNSLALGWLKKKKMNNSDFYCFGLAI